jgi:hypothetical protein
MKGSYCDTCGGDCKGWPREPLGCDEVDDLRNCMYARLGYTFDNAEEWREALRQGGVVCAQRRLPMGGRVSLAGPQRHLAEEETGTAGLHPVADPR